MVNKSNPYIAFNYPSDELCWFSSSAWMVEALEAEAGLKEFLGLKARPLLLIMSKSWYGTNEKSPMEETQLGKTKIRCWSNGLPGPMS